MRSEFYKGLTEWFKTDGRVVILLGDIGVFSLRECVEHDNARIYNMGINEQATIGAACGLASQGFIPVVHSIAPFITERTYEQVKLLAYEKKCVIIVSVGASYDYAKLGITHYCPNDIRIMSAIPGLNVYCPGNIYDVETAIAESIREGKPAYIRLSETSNDLTSGTSEILKEHKGGMVLIVGNSILDTSRLQEINATVVYGYNMSKNLTEELRDAMFQTGIKGPITLVEPCAPSGILDCLEHHSISVPKMYIDKYGSKAEIDDYLGLTDDLIINRLKEIYNKEES